ncbi:MAG: TetR/AcrR family transcriptional regulator [Actinomycetota bacterium]|nr:TetR/AcrR family transcriptional regulator [Actinomycetota bacterium]MDA3028455.1 TetR/AcrR family transcriptional regulator [Actinomycetota bacterium]
MTGEPDKRPRGRPKTFDREHTLDVAVDSYWRDGVDAVSLNEICRRAGVAKPGVYREFGDEDHLMDAVLARYHTDVLRPILASLDRDQPFQQAVDSLLAMLTRPTRAGRPSGCMIAKMRAARPRLGPVTGARLDRIRAEAIATYATWLRRSVERGQIALREPLETTAAYIDAQLTLTLNRIAAGESPTTVRTHAHMAFTAITRADAHDLG